MTNTTIDPELQRLLASMAGLTEQLRAAAEANNIELGISAALAARALEALAQCSALCPEAVCTVHSALVLIMEAMDAAIPDEDDPARALGLANDAEGVFTDRLSRASRCMVEAAGLACLRLYRGGVEPEEPAEGRAAEAVATALALALAVDGPAGE